MTDAEQWFMSLKEAGGCRWSSSATPARTMTCPDRGAVAALWTGWGRLRQWFGHWLQADGVQATDGGRGGGGVVRR